MATRSSNNTKQKRATTSTEKLSRELELVRPVRTCPLKEEALTIIPNSSFRLGEQDETWPKEGVRIIGQTETKNRPHHPYLKQLTTRWNWSRSMRHRQLHLLLKPRTSTCYLDSAFDKSILLILEYRLCFIII